MMPKTTFYQVQIAHIEPLTQDAVELTLDIAKDLKPLFAFEAGQYITFKKNIQNQELRRSYSICSAPSQNCIKVAVKCVPNGLFSTYANTQLKVGDSIEVMPPMGNFVVKAPASTNPHYLGIAVGSGITPIISIIKDVLYKNESSRFTLLFGNKMVGSIMFREELEYLKNTYMDRLQIIHILSQEHLEADINHGRINQEKCQHIFAKLIDIKTIDAAYICGPETLVQNTKQFLETAGMPLANIYFELFGTNLQYQGKKDSQTINPSGPTSQVSIKVDDRTMILNLAYDGDSILDSALKNGADLPFACKGGVCCTCRAKVIEGTVKMDVNYALDEQEVKDGFYT